MTITCSPIVTGIVGSPFVQGLDLPAALKAQQRAGAVPGMLSAAERALLRELVRRTWRGDGVIIDGGSFFGSSLVALATGLEANPKAPIVDLDGFHGGKPIHGYELGFLPAPASDKVDRRRVFGGVEYLLGDSFVPILKDNIGPHRQFVELHIGDLNEETWDGSPVEIAFIDVCKTARLNAHVSREFYPAMIGGASTLVNQDFFFDRLPWIKVTMGYLKEYFRWEGQVFTSSIYSNVKAVPQDVAGHDPFTEDSYEECLAYHDAVEFPGIDWKSKYFMSLSRGYLMALKNRKEQALEHLRAVADEFADLLGDDDNPRGNQFRMDRAVRQISNGNIFKVS
ncbi:MAG TPA: hypothetical protein VFJ14_05355 [Nocardioidaceae bacterium]|nr:hypothetical protein [Nocardioidaceae bacterium]